ncbi:LppA family lipoprotein [[Mycobacterium] wendilense]|uniref:LppA family lipoprotein n=1 Tax=[Mycobacterium] wendilense TaxID=3064284 RepID=A0ABM9M8C3_9MYCO|nr:LppA family lipoprotein [Mycolicibacterium sp. MU0050]CAJ1578895.1 LppA family lipoprotein [Mycolicibacterium sp. MU0050]
MERKRSATRRPAARSRILAAVLAVAVLTGCQQAASGPDISEEKAPTMDLAQLPTLKQTQAQMLELIFAVEREISQLVPALKPWWWNRQYSALHCEGGMGLGFPSLVSEHALSDAEWELVYPVVQRLAAEAGLASAGGFQNQSGNHDARIYSGDGRMLMFASRKATLLSADISCRRTDDGSVWVGEEIPMPPNPQP